MYYVAKIVGIALFPTSDNLQEKDGNLNTLFM